MGRSGPRAHAGSRAWYRPIAPGAALPAALRNLAARSGPANAGPPRRAAACCDIGSARGPGGRAQDQHPAITASATQLAVRAVIGH